MAELVIKDVDDSMVAQLTRQAEAVGRSLQDELKVILSRAALYSAPASVSKTEARNLADDMRRRLEGRRHTDSVELLREDRSR